MVLITIYAIMTLLAIYQPTWERVYSCCALTTVNAMFMIVGDTVDSGWYYVFAAMADLLILIMLMPFSDRDALARNLSIVTGISILLNVIGLLSWYNFSEPNLYNNAYIALLLWVIILMITTKDSNVADNGADRLQSRDAVNRDSRHDDIDGSKKAI